MSNVDKSLNTIETSNLIDFNSPDVTQFNYLNLAKPLIPAPQNTRILLPPRDSLENNPFDKVFKETNLHLVKDNDPFEIVFQRAYSESDGSNNLNTMKIRNKTYVKQTKTYEEFDTLDLSLEILDDSVFTTFSESVNNNSNNLKSSPQCKPSPLRSAPIMSENNSLNIKTPEDIERKNNECMSPFVASEIQNSISRRINRYTDTASPIRNTPELFDDFKCIRRAYSNNAISNTLLKTDDILSNLETLKNRMNESDSIGTPSFLNQAFEMTSLQDSDRLLKTYTLDSDSLASQGGNLDKAFHEQLMRRPSYGTNTYQNIFTNPLVGQKSLSARKPTKQELGLMSLRQSCFTNPSSKIFTFQKRLDNLAGNNHKVLYEEICKKKIQQELNASILFEAKQLAETFSKAAHGSLILDEKLSDDSLENELLTSNPNWDILDDLDIKLPLDVEKKVEKDDIFKKIDKIFPQQNLNEVKQKSIEELNTSENVNKFTNSEKQINIKSVDENQDLNSEKFNAVMKTTPKKSHNSKRKDHTIELLENLTELLKNNENTKESKKQLKKKLITSLSNVLANNDAEEDLDSTVSVNSDDNLIEETEEPKKPTRSVSFNLKPLGEINSNIVNNTNRAKSLNQEPIEINTNKSKNNEHKSSNNLIQKMGQKLRPKRSDINRIENKENHRGPLKAVIPVNNMAKDSAKMSISSKLNGIGKNVKSDTSKSKIKPMAQSTPTNTNSTSKIRRPSSLSISPIIQNSPCGFKTPTSMPPQSTPIPTSRLLRKPSSLDNISNLSSNSPKKINKKQSMNSSTLSSFPSSNDASSEVFEKSARKLTSVQSSSSITGMRKQTPLQLIRRKSASEILKSNNIPNTVIKPISKDIKSSGSAEPKLSFFSKIRRSYSNPSGKNNGIKYK